MNPFILTPARKKDFVDRELIVEQVLDIVIGKGLGDVWVEGERQVGKTSLLQFLEYKGDELVDSFTHYHTEKEMTPTFLYFNVQAVETIDEFYKLSADSIRSRFDMKGKTVKNAYDNFVDHLKIIFKNGFYPVLLIDEFDSMLENFDARQLVLFIKKFNATLEHIHSLPLKPKAFSCIFASNSSFSEILYAKDVNIKSQSGLKFESVDLTWFPKQYVAEMAERYLQKNKVRFTPKEIDLCFKYTQGYPYFTQKMFRLMYNAKMKITDYKEFERFVKEAIGKEFERTIKNWGAEKMPNRTIYKLKELFNSKAADKVIDLSFKALDSIIKSQLMR